MYLVTFFSQFDSNQFYRTYSKLGEVVRRPVPRELSSSCGTCCSFEPKKENDKDYNAMFQDAEYEKIYIVTENLSSGKSKVDYRMILERA